MTTEAPQHGPPTGAPRPPAAHPRHRLDGRALPRLPRLRALVLHAAAWGLVCALSLLWGHPALLAQKGGDPGPAPTAQPEPTVPPKPTADPGYPPLHAGPARASESVWWVEFEGQAVPCGDPRGDLAGLAVTGATRVDITCAAADGLTRTVATVVGECRAVAWYGVAQERRWCVGLPLVGR